MAIFKFLPYKCNYDVWYGGPFSFRREHPLVKGTNHRMNGTTQHESGEAAVIYLFLPLTVFLLPFTENI
jgi:hypothetical protein